MRIINKALLLALPFSFSIYANTNLHTVFVINDEKPLATFTVPSNVKMKITSDKVVEDKDSVQRFIGNAHITLSYPTGSTVIMKASEIDISG